MVIQESLLPHAAGEEGFGILSVLLVNTGKKSST